MYYYCNGFVDDTTMTKILQYHVTQSFALLFKQPHLQCPFPARPPSSHITNPNMAPVCHVSGADEWLDGAVGDGAIQEDRQEGGQEDRRCAGGGEGR